VRAELDAESDTGALHRRLQQLDPAAATKTTPQNRRRIVRALEVTVGSGRPFSSFGPGLQAYPESAIAQIGLRVARPALATRIEQRVHQMIAAGLLDEVRTLAARPRGLSRTARQALGYKELLDHLDGQVSLDEAVARIVVRTRQFAARQERWFRRDPRIRWISVDDGPGPALAELERAVLR
jgi:tRNA dimethylallyltransferase